MIPGAPENKMMPTRIYAVHHYSLVHKLGYPQGAKCNWCGAEFAPGPREKGVTQKRREWFTLHDQCEATQLKHSVQER